MIDLKDMFKKNKLVLILLMFFTVILCLTMFILDSASAYNINDGTISRKNNTNFDNTISANSVPSNYDTKAKVIKNENNKTISFFYNVEDLPEGDVYDFETNTWKITKQSDKGYNYIIDNSFIDYYPQNGSFCFSNANSITNLRGFNTSNITTMKGMFAYSKINNLDLSSFDTANVENMYGMFYYCSQLENLNISNLNTSKTIDFTDMFRECYILNNIDLKSFDTSNATSLSGMFDTCYKVSKLDVSKFDTSKVTNMKFMFNQCENITDLDVSNFNTKNVTTFEAMFQGVTNVAYINVSHFVTSQAKDFEFMFQDCKNLKDIDCSSFDTSKSPFLNNMFCQCKSLKKLDLSSFETTQVEDFSNLIWYDENLETLDISNFKFDKMLDIEGIFGQCKNLKTIYTSKDVNFSTRETIYAYENIFLYDYNLVGGNGTTYDIENFELDYARVDGLEGLPGYFTAKIDINNAKINKIDDQIYTGSLITPKINVYYSNNKLTEDTDYKIAYFDNINVGVAKVSITGINKYCGTKICEFNIISNNSGNTDDTKSQVINSNSYDTTQTGDNNLLFISTLICCVCICSYLLKKAIKQY